MSAVCSADRASTWRSRSSAKSSTGPSTAARPAATDSRSPAPTSCVPRSRSDVAQASIHAIAVVDPSARIGSGVEVGAFTFIGADVEIGDGTHVGPHCSIHGPTRIGRDNRIHGHAAIGGDPQDKKYGSERVALEIGDGNVISEFTSKIGRASSRERGGQYE